MSIAKALQHVYNYSNDKFNLPLNYENRANQDFYEIEVSMWRLKYSCVSLSVYYWVGPSKNSLSIRIHYCHVVVIGTKFLPIKYKVLIVLNWNIKK